MTNLWRSLAKRAFRKYDYTKQISVRVKNHTECTQSSFHVICDIDKTYLETKFETFYQIARIAFEKASSKRMVRGASEVLLAARWSYAEQNFKTGSDEAILPNGLHFISSSPTQLRSVLEQKLVMDGLDWSSDTFKNQTYNILSGRMDLLKHHVAYKSAAILDIISLGPKHAKYVFIGDNAEWDAYVYVGVQLLASKKLSPLSFCEYLKIAGVDSIIANDLTSQKAEAVVGKNISGILIRKDPDYPFISNPHLTERVSLFDSYLEAAICLVKWNYIHVNHLLPILRSFHNRHGFPLDEISKVTRSVDFDADSEIITKKALSLCEDLMHLPLPKTKEGKKLHVPAAGIIPAANLLEADILNQAKEWVTKIKLSKRNSKSTSLPTMESSLIGK